jgi:hypothetical protein
MQRHDHRSRSQISRAPAPPCLERRTTTAPRKTTECGNNIVRKPDSYSDCNFISYYLQLYTWQNEAKFGSSIKDIERRKDQSNVRRPLAAQIMEPIFHEFIDENGGGSPLCVSRKQHTASYDSRPATSVRYFSYSAREIRAPSRSTRARSFAGNEVCMSSTRFHGAKGVSPVERGTNLDGWIFW